MNFSGGKDSLTCLLLALKATDHVECLYMDSGMELPSTLPYVRSRCREFGVPLTVSHPAKDPAPHRVPGPMPPGCCLLPDYIRHFGYFPTAAKRYCAIYLKQRPLRVCLRKRFHDASLFKVVGIRLAESPRRRWKYGSAASIRKYGGRDIRPDTEHAGSFLVMPILDWSDQQIRDFLAAERVALHDGYKVFGTSGCAWCPVMKPAQAQKIHRVYPPIYDDLLAAEEAIMKPAWVHKYVWLRDVVRARAPVSEGVPHDAGQAALREAVERASETTGDRSCCPAFSLRVVLPPRFSAAPPPT